MSMFFNGQNQEEKHGFFAYPFNTTKSNNSSIVPDSVLCQMFTVNVLFTHLTYHNFNMDPLLNPTRGNTFETISCSLPDWVRLESLRVTT